MKFMVMVKDMVAAWREERAACMQWWWLYSSVGGRDVMAIVWRSNGVESGGAGVFDCSCLHAWWQQSWQPHVVLFLCVVLK